MNLNKEADKWYIQMNKRSSVAQNTSIAICLRHIQPVPHIHNSKHITSEVLNKNGNMVLVPSQTNQFL